MLISDESFKSVNFTGFLNQSGTHSWQEYLPRPYKGWWILEDRNLQVNLGATIYYDINIMYKNGLSTSVRGQWTVSGKFNLANFRIFGLYNIYQIVSLLVYFTNSPHFDYRFF